MSRKEIPIAGLSPPKVLRYRMPAIQSRVIGKKTIIENLDQIAKALHRSVDEIVKFFGTRYYPTDWKSLSINAKGKPSPPVAVLRTVRVTPELQDQLSEYIEHFVLCPVCRLPETRYVVQKISSTGIGVGGSGGNGLFHQCASCHERSQIRYENPRLIEFIMSELQRKEVALKEQGTSIEEEQSKYWGIQSNSSLIFMSKVNLMEMKPAVEEEQPSHFMSSSASSSNSSLNNEDLAKQMKEVFEDSESAMEDIETVIKRFKIYLDNHPAAKVKDQLEELKKLQTMASLRPADRCVIYLGAVFTENAVAENDVEKHQEMLQALAASEIQQRHLLAAAEWFCGSRFPNLIRVFPKLLMQLYDAEVVEEDTFLAWAADTTRNEFTVDTSLIAFETLEVLHAAAAPFIKWLQEAEEEEDDDKEFDV